VRGIFVMAYKEKRERRLKYQKYWPTEVAPLVAHTSLGPLPLYKLAYIISNYKTYKANLHKRKQFSPNMQLTIDI
jgi:hypothetical protein